MDKLLTRRVATGWYNVLQWGQVGFCFMAGIKINCVWGPCTSKFEG